MTVADRKSTRLNSSHLVISYAVFCLKKKTLATGGQPNDDGKDGRTMASLTMTELLEAGVHFGPQTKRSNPKMQKYIFGERNGIYILDLQKTLKKFREAYAFVRDLAAGGGTVLFVGTKKQAQGTVFEAATRGGQFYVNQRWLGGTLTNFATIRKSIARLKKLEEMKETGEFERVPKKE